MFGFTIPTRLQKRNTMEDGFTYYESNDTETLVMIKLIDDGSPTEYDVRVAKNRLHSYYTAGMTFKMKVSFHQDLLEELERYLATSPPQIYK